MLTYKTTLNDMLAYRGFKNPSNFSESFRVKKKNEIIEVRYLIENRTNSKKISTIVDIICSNLKESDKSKEITIILVVNEPKITPTIKETIRNLNIKYNVYIQIFSLKSLLFDITKHELCPKHERIKKSEYNEYIDDFLDLHHINTLDNLPKILESDPVAMYIGLRAGDMCKIVRPSKAAGMINVYRYCVSA